MNEWTDTGSSAAILSSPREPWILDRINLEGEIFNIDRTRKEIEPLIARSSCDLISSSYRWSFALSIFYTDPGINDSIIGSNIVCTSRMGITDIESLELEYLDIADTPTSCNCLTTCRCSDSTRDACIIRILLDIPTQIGSFFGCLVYEIELLHKTRENTRNISDSSIIIISDDRSTRIAILVSEIIIRIPIVVGELSEILSISLI